jgi:hypothetical protein
MHHRPGIGYRQSQFDLQEAARGCLRATKMKRVVLVERARHGPLSGVSAVHCYLAWNRLLGLHGPVAAYSWGSNMDSTCMAIIPTVRSSSNTALWQPYLYLPRIV